MVNQLKIITMTKLALYDKHEGLADQAANDYFRHDYIYRKNLGTRIAVGIGGVIVLAIYWVQNILTGEWDIFNFSIQDYVTESIIFILALLAVYSFIGTIQGTREYHLVQQRIRKYQGLLRLLERIDERGDKATLPDDTPEAVKAGQKESAKPEAPDAKHEPPPRVSDRAARPGVGNAGTVSRTGSGQAAAASRQPGTAHGRQPASTFKRQPGAAYAGVNARRRQQLRQDTRQTSGVGSGLRRAERPYTRPGRPPGSPPRYSMRDK